MIKRFPSRGQRSKGIKVKHILQIILLLGVCFWLIYQVKRNHDKKKEFDENDAKLSVGAQTDPVLKLGRKDLPVKDGLNRNEKHEEETEEEENIVEDEEIKPELNEQEEEGNKHETEESDEDKNGVGEQGEEENNHGAEEQEEDENRSEEIDDDGRGGGGDEEIDENDQDKLEVDGDRDEEFMDEEKEKEEGDEKENESNEDEKKGDSVENHSTHEAREEHYKGDDASSAVTHDTHTISTETETFSLESSDVNSETIITKPENRTSDSDESNRNQNDSDLKVTEGELADGMSSNATAGKVTGTDSLFSRDSSYPNKTVTTNSDSLLEADNKSALVTSESSNNMTGAGNDTSSLSEQNKMVILLESHHTQNTTVNAMVSGDVKNVPMEGLEQGGNGVPEKNLTDANSTVSVKIEHGDAGSGEPSNPGAGELEKTIDVVAANETANNSTNSDRNGSSDASETSETNETQNVDATEDEMFRSDTQTDETDEALDSSSTNGISDSVEHDGIDDSQMHEDVTEVRTDLDTLPDIRNEGDNDDETAAE